MKSQSGEKSLWYNAAMINKDLSDIDWENCEIQKIDQLSNRIIILENDQSVSVDIPPILFKALIRKGEHNFIDSDLEIHDGGII